MSDSAVKSVKSVKSPKAAKAAKPAAKAKVTAPVQAPRVLRDLPSTSIARVEIASVFAAGGPGQDAHVRIVCDGAGWIVGVRVAGADDAHAHRLTIAGIPCDSHPTGRDNARLVMPGQVVCAWLSSPTVTTELALVLDFDVIDPAVLREFMAGEFSGNADAFSGNVIEK